MSEEIGRQSENNTKGSGRQSDQSSWMSHWMRTGHNPAGEAQNLRAPAIERLNHTSADESLSSRFEISGSANKVAAIETIKFRILNENLRSSLKSMESEGIHTSAFIHGQGTHDERELPHAFGQNLDYGSALVCKSGIEVPSVIPTTNRSFMRGLGEGTSNNPLDWMKGHSAEEDRSFGALKPFAGTFVESLSHIVPQRFEFESRKTDKGKSAISSLENRSILALNNPLPDYNLRMSEHEHLHSGSQPTDLACERKIDNHLFFDSPSTSHPHLSQFDQGWFRNMQKYSSIELIPTMENTKTKNSHHDRKFSTSVHDVETLRIFSQTTHSLLITQKTEVDSLKENNAFRSTRVITEIDRNDLCGLSPFFGQGNQGVKIQLLSSSSDSEQKGNVSDIKCSNVSVKNESSAETDTLDFDFLKENLHAGTDSTTSPKMEFMGLPDMNVKLPANFAEDFCATSSRTQSLEMDMLLVHAEQPNINQSLINSTEADPNSSRWVKRLKLNSSKYSTTQIARISNLDENLSHDKMGKYFSKILKNTINSSSNQIPEEDPNLSMVGGHTKKGVDLLLSQSWIQRWLSDESRITRNKNGNGVIVCEAQNSKLELEELEKKQFPSIGAMALMGKAMNGFQPCELQKRGSFTVWNTKAF